MAYSKIQAIERYQRKLRQATFQDLLGQITGANTDLVSFETVAGRFNARQEIARGVQNVELDQIVGSVGRYRDFTREFLPRSGISRERWTEVEMALYGMTGWPPIDLYKIGDVYFVRDGNHRVSVARANGISQIEAYVTELDMPISLTADDFQRDTWIIKAEYAEFMTWSGLAMTRPENQISLTAPGRYATLQGHVEVHGYYLNQEMDRRGESRRLVTLEAAASWYDAVYLPMVGALQDYGLLEQFPDRTETDLYLWIAEHREELRHQYELAEVSPAVAVATFAQTHSENPLEQGWKHLQFGLFAGGGDAAPPGMGQDEFVHSTQARMDFLERSHLSTLRPDQNIALTHGAQYDLLFRHIEEHWYFCNQQVGRDENGRQLSWEEAVQSWYDTVYLPLIQELHRQDVLEHFSGLTETDLYLALAEHREDLAVSFELAPLSPAEAVRTFLQVYGGRPWARTLKGLRLGWYWMRGETKPLGMSEDEFEQSRARRQAGERPVSEMQS